MKLKHKAFVFNFLAFAVLFLAVRFGTSYVLDLSSLFVSITAAVIATILAPKFAVVRNEGREKLMMKWLFMKNSKEIKL